MKRFFSIFICLILVLCVVPLASCSQSGGYEGEVNVYNWGEYISNGDDDSLDVIAEFEKRYNIKVNYTNFETNEELYNILTNSNSSYDVIIPSEYMVGRLIDEGLLEEINYDNVPNYQYIMDKFKHLDFDPERKYTVPYTWGVVALVYNTTMIEEGEIKGFSDLWNEKYKDTILMFNNSRDATAISMQLCDPPINPGKKSFTHEDIDRATDKLVEQKSVLKKYVMDQVFTEMENSQSAIAPYYAGDIYTMMDNNEDLTYCLPEEGSNFFVDAMCIPTCCQNKDNAELFINFMCDPEIALANTEYIGYATPNQAAFDMLDEETKNCELIYPSQDYLDKCYIFANIDNDIYSYMQEKFVKACSSTAEVSETTETAKSSPTATIIVCIILAIIIFATLYVIVYDIVKKLKKRKT